MSMMIVGRVGLKVWPDLRNFRRELKAEAEKAAAGIEVEVPAKIDGDKLNDQLRILLIKLQAQADKKPIKIHTVLDVDRRALDKIEGKKVIKIDFDSSHLDKLLGDLNKKRNLDLDIQDSKLQKLLDRLRKVTVDLKPKLTDERELARVRKEMLAWFERFRPKVTPDFVIDEGEVREKQGKLAKLWSRFRIKLGMELDDSHLSDSLRDALRKADFQKMLDKHIGKSRVDIDFHPQFDSKALAAIKARLATLTAPIATRVKPVLDSLAVRWVRAELAAAARSVTARIKAAVDDGSLARAVGKIQLAVRDVTAKVKVVLDKKSVRDVGEALKAMSGWRLMRKVFSIEVLKNLDLALPKITAISGAAAAAALALTALTSSTLILGRHLAQIAYLGLAIPGVLVGMGVAAWAFVRALKDTDKYVPQIAKGFADIGETISKKFWGQAQKPLSTLANDWLPRIKAGMDGVATAAGKSFGELSKNLLTLGPSLKPWFSSVESFVSNLGKGASGFTKAIKGLGDIGAHYLPKVGQYVADVTNRFGEWITAAVASGEAFAWVDRAWKNLVNLGSAIADAWRGLSNLAAAAEAAGGFGLDNLAASMKRFAEVTKENQAGITAFFKASNEGWQEFTKGAGHGLESVGKMVASVADRLLPAMGRLAGLLVGSLGEILGNEAVGQGLVSMFTNLTIAIRNLGPALDPLGKGLGSLMELVGKLALAVSGPLALALQGLGPMAEGLLDALGDVALHLGSGLTAAMQAVLPHFREATPIIADFVREIGTKLGDALAKVAPHLGEFAGGVADFIKSVGPEVTKGLSGFIDFLVDLAGKINWKMVANDIRFLGEVIGGFFAYLNNPANRSDLGGLTDGLKGIQEFIQKIPSSAAVSLGALGGLFGNVGKEITGFFARIPENVATSLGSLGELFSGIGKSISDAFAKLGDLWDRVTSQFAKNNAELGQSFGETFDRIGRDIQGIGQRIGDFFAPVGTAISNALDGVAAMWKPFWDGLVADVSNFGGEVKVQWDIFWKSISITAGALLKGDWQALWNGLPDGVKEFAVKAKQGWDDFWSKLSSGDMGGALKAAWRGFWHLLPEDVQKFVDDAKMKWDRFWADLTSGELGANLKASWDGFWGGLAAKVTEPLAEVKTKWDTFWQGLTGLGGAEPQVGASAMSFGTSATLPITTKTAELKSHWDTFWGGLSGAVTTGLGSAAASAATGAEAARSNVTSKLAQLASEWSSKWSGMPAAVSSWAATSAASAASGAGRIKDSIVSNLTQAASSLGSKFGEMTGSVASGMSSMASSASSGASRMMSAISSAGSSMASSIRSAGSSMVSGMSSAMAGLVGAVQSGAEHAVSTASSIRGRIIGVFAGAGGWLVASGRSIMEGLASGILSGISAATSAISRAMSAVRAYAPFSPAKVGPFSGKGWMTYSGRSISEAFAQGIKDSSHLPVEATKSLMSSVHDPFESTLSRNNSRISRAMSTDGAEARGGDTLTIGDITIGPDDPDYAELVELVKVLRRKMRAHGGI